MPRIAEELIEQVRQSIDIVDVVGEHLTLAKKGKSFLGLCPFHDDSKPSFNVSQEKQIYKCFACGEGGNVFSFLVKIEGVSFIEAVRKLADRAGVSLPENQNSMAEGQESFDRLYDAIELARKYYHFLLMEHDSGAAARNYLKERGLSEETMISFSLGYAPNGWDGLLGMATRRKISPETLEQSGLVIGRDNGSGHYDRFRHRIIFPIYAHTGRTVAFGARALDPQEQAKYINSPETPIYNKSTILYGLWHGRNAIRDNRVALIVEGYMDLIALWQSGIQHTVASSGTALTSQHARLLKRFADQAVLVFDGDAAGTAAAVRGIGSLYESGIETRVVSLPENHDPDSFVRANGTEGFHSLVKEARPVLDFLIDWASREEDLSTADGKARAATMLAEFVGRVTNRALRQFLVKETSEKLGLDEQIVIEMIQQSRRSRTVVKNGSSAPLPVFDPRPRSERELIIQMMGDGITADTVLKEVQLEDFTNSAYRKIVSLIGSTRNKGQSLEPAKLIDQYPELAGIISNLTMELGIADPSKPQLPIQDYIYNFQLRKLEAQIDQLEDNLRSAQREPDLKKLMVEHRDLTIQRRALVEAKRQPAEVPGD